MVTTLATCALLAWLDLRRARALGGART